MNIASLLSGGLTSGITSTIAKTLNIDESKAKWVVSAAIPLIIAGLNYNAKNKGQADNINNALNQHAGSGILDGLTGLLSGGPTADGSKIIGHVFGANSGYVEQNLSEKSGLSAGQVSGILAMLAPMVMGALGQQKQQSSAGGVTDLLGSLLGGGTQTQQSGGGLLGSVLGGLLGGGQKTQAAPQGGLDNIMDLAGVFFNKQNNTQQNGNVLDSLAGLLGK